MRQYSGLQVENYKGVVVPSLVNTCITFPRLSYLI